jgi:hypothetical protein
MTGVYAMAIDVERRRARERERLRKLRAAARIERQAERAEQQAAADEELARYGGDAMAWLLARWRAEANALPAALARLASQGPAMPGEGPQDGRRSPRARARPPPV